MWYIIIIQVIRLRRKYDLYSADEEIVYIAHSSDPSTVTPVDVFSILSNKDGNWVLRTYNREGATPDINPKAVHTYTGKGVARISFIEIRGTRITLLIYFCLK